MKKALELIRVSTEGQAAEDRAGIPAQRTANRRTAAQYGLEIVRTFQIEDVSGAAILRAPQMQELLTVIESPEIHGVIAREFSRLMRPEDFSDYVILQAFADSNTTLYLPEGPLDFTSKTGRLMGTIRAAIAGAERSEILERMWSGKEHKRRQGKNPQSKVTLPFGVGYDAARGFFYKAEAEKVREAFSRFLGGETSYVELARLVGVTPRGMHLIMRNRIWTGWRVLDKKRDPSPSARRVKADGRQGDRPKVKRAEDEIIRVRVIETPLISEIDFQRVQQIMDLKQQKHWRADRDHESRFTYQGFTICGDCGDILYGTYQRDDYYVCKSRRLKTGCVASYMRRDRLEGRIDQLLGDQVTDRGFLKEIEASWEAASERGQDRNRISRLRSELLALEQKRKRVLDSYFEGVINRDERDTRVSAIQRDSDSYKAMLLREPAETRLSAEQLAEVFSPFVEWKFLTRAQKRRMLVSTAPEIRVANYQVQGISLLADACVATKETRRDTDSSPPPA